MLFRLDAMRGFRGEGTASANDAFVRAGFVGFLESLPLLFLLLECVGFGSRSLTTGSRLHNVRGGVAKASRPEHTFERYVRPLSAMYHSLVIPCIDLISFRARETYPGPPRACT